MCDWGTSKVLVPGGAQDGSKSVLDSESHCPYPRFAPFASVLLRVINEHRVDVNASTECFGILGNEHWIVGTNVGRLNGIPNIVVDDAVPDLRDSDEVGRVRIFGEDQGEDFVGRKDCGTGWVIVGLVIDCRGLECFRRGLDSQGRRIVRTGRFLCFFQILLRVHVDSHVGFVQ